jgi:hypothetical protein
MPVILYIIFALSESIPKFDSSVARARDNLSVVSAEADGQNIGGVADKSAGSGTSVEVPQPECMVPGRRQRELPVGGYYYIRYEVIVSMKNSLWVSI